jgi:hypothetical protein
MANAKIPQRYQAVLDAPWSLSNLESDYVQRRAYLSDSPVVVSGLSHGVLQKSVELFLSEHIEEFIAAPAPEPDRTSDLRFHNAFACMLLTCTSKAMLNGMEPPPYSWVQPWIELAMVDRSVDRIATLPFIASQAYPIETRRGLLEQLVRKVLLNGKDTYVRQILADSTLCTILVLNQLMVARLTQMEVETACKNLFDNVEVGVTAEKAIETYAPAIAPHWHIITALGLTFREACYLVLVRPGGEELLPDAIGS